RAVGAQCRPRQPRPFADRAHRARAPAAAARRALDRRGRARGMSYVPLTPLDLALAAALLLVNAAVSWLFTLRLERTLAIAAVRMVVQLALIALVLKFIFAQTSPVWTLLLALVMVSAAGVEVMTRQHRRLAGWQPWGLSTATLLFIGLAITGLGVGVIV